MQGKKINIWLDCDPGLDDAIAIILAAHDQRINLLGISTSPGNTSLQNTTQNALDVLHNCGRDDIQVIEGSNQLIKGVMVLAEHMHGSNGLGGVQIQKSSKHAIKQENFNAIRDLIVKSHEKIIWANTGSLTNLYIILSKYPQVKQKIKQIVIMGGAIGAGNITPAAQFNIYFDPHAAKGVFDIKGDIPLVMIPLDLTHQVRANEKVLKHMQKYHHSFAKAILDMLIAFQKMYKKAFDFDYPPVHDPCVIYYILEPQQFKVKKARIQVDTYPVSYGRTNCYFSNPKNPQQTLDTIDYVGLQIKNVDKFWELNFKHYDQLFSSKK